MPRYAAMECTTPGEKGDPIIHMMADSPDAVPSDVRPVDPKNGHHLQMTRYAQDAAKQGASAEAIASRFGYAGYLAAA